MRNLDRTQTAQRGVVVAHVADPGDHGSAHERVTLLAFARRLAALRGEADGGLFDEAQPYQGPVYFVPNCTLTAGEARALGIRGHDDLFGGVVPHAFVGTKAISHPLLRPDCAAVAGWDHRLAALVGDDVLAGFTAFTPADALAAGRRLLDAGPVRLKPVRATGGLGQRVVRDAAALQEAIDAMDADEIRRHGLVLEEDLQDVHTFSVGQVRVADLLASYHGRQKLTRDNAGREVYGGSDLQVARGGFDALLAGDLPDDAIRRAIEQAGRYDAAVRSCFTGFFASRSNYDIVVGRDAAGRRRSGVLEQSWRVGGATGCELAALEVLRREPRRASVHARGFEVFGDGPEPPAGAIVHFRGDDPAAGRLAKYTLVEE